MKIAIITGGSRGLGKSMSLHLAAKDHDVILTYNSKQKEAEEVVSEIEKTGRKAVALKLDASDHKSACSSDYHGPRHRLFSRFLAYELHGRTPALGRLAPEA